MIRAVSPTISVVMAVYNGERYLSASIDIILSQTYADFEYVIVNDGSNDTSGEILAAYARQEPRIQIVHQMNQGLTRSLNMAIARATGMYIARQDADDISLSERLATQLEYLESRGLDLVSSDFVGFDDTGDLHVSRPSAKRFLLLRSLVLGNNLAHGTFFFRRLPALVYDEHFHYSQDFELWLRSVRTGRRVGIVAAVLARIRKHPGNLSTTSRQEQSRYGIMAIRKHYNHFWPFVYLARKALGNIVSIG